MEDRREKINSLTVLIKDIVFLYTLFFLSVLTNYKAPSFINSAFQVLIILAFWQSKRDYFWLALVIIIESYPGFLFDPLDPLHSFSIIRQGPFGNLYFWIVFTLAAFLKHVHKSKKPFFLNTSIILLFGYFAFQIAMFGVYKPQAVFRFLLPWLYIFLLPKILKDDEDIAGFFNLIFSFVIVVLAAQSYRIYTGSEISGLLGGLPSFGGIVRGGIEEMTSAMRPVYGGHISILAIWGSFLMLSQKTKKFSDAYLILILAMSVFSVFLAASRAWLISTIFLLVGFMFLMTRKKLRLQVGLLLAALIIVVLVVRIPFLEKQSDLAIQRYKTIELLLRGDLTAGGTLMRYDQRAPRVMAAFFESPVFGWGVGDRARYYGDGHVGYQNLLMSGGLVGFALFFLMWVNIIKKMMESYRLLPYGHEKKKHPLVIIILLFGMLIVHAAAQWFGYLMPFILGFFVMLLLTRANDIYLEAQGCQFLKIKT